MISSINVLEFVEKFCSLGDIIGAGGGTEEASIAIVRYIYY